MIVTSTVIDLATPSCINAQIWCVLATIPFLILGAWLSAELGESVYIKARYERWPYKKAEILGFFSGLVLLLCFVLIGFVAYIHTISSC